MTETYGVLTVGAVNSGTVAVGQEVTGAGVVPHTAIEGNLSGSGPGSTWLVNNAQRVAGENMTMRATPLSVVLDQITSLSSAQPKTTTFSMSRRKALSASMTTNRP